VDNQGVGKVTGWNNNKKVKGRIKKVNERSRRIKKAGESARSRQGLKVRGN
jgi:hypothetical protein